MKQYYFFCIDNEFYRTIYKDFDSLCFCKSIYLPERMQLLFYKLINIWFFPFIKLRGMICCFIYRKRINTIFKPTSYGNNCYIVYGRLLDIYGPTIIEYLRKIDRTSIIVIYLADVMSSFSFNIKYIKRNTDYIYSIDRKDTVRYNLKYLQEPYSYTFHKNTNKYNNDVFFVGRAKNRLDIILSYYLKLKQLGYKCLFYIYEVDKQNQKYNDDIHYNEYLNYNELLKLVFDSKCILEISQKNADSITTRFSEAVLYKKILLTNCKIVNNIEKLPNNIIFCNDINILDKINLDCMDYDNTYWIKELSIDNFIKKIEYNINEWR